MHGFWAGLLVAAWTASAEALTPFRPLTQAEMAEGWLLLFDGESAYGWTITGDSRVDKGMLILGGQGATTARSHYRFGAHQLVYQISDDAEKWQSVERKSDGALTFHVPAGQRRYLRNVRAKPLDLKPIFNGKDLTGWKTHPDKKASRFTVTPEGWLHVQNGPGDLQTEAQWDDFVLQLECISHGRHLNSGIFFRCLPGQYQQGYEAQIRNEWKDGDRTQPVDFGTGAIYRRVPARKVVSSDHEWFTLTILARHKHLATWVNGYPVVSWIDDRPPAENARNGFKAGKGAISIQGHDPTTNLSFRRLRLVPLSEPAANPAPSQ